MIAKVELSASDLKKVIAEHLGVKPEDVSFVLEKEYDWRGDAYGSSVKAVVTIDYHPFEKK